MRTVASLRERPKDSRTPEGLLEMGRLYQSVGKIDDAMPIYQRNIKENGKTPAAYASAVNLARCYMMQGPGQFEQAEKSLLSLVQDNLDLGPTANEFRTSLFTLGELYYNNALGGCDTAAGRGRRSLSVGQGGAAGVLHVGGELSQERGGHSGGD